MRKTHAWLTIVLVISVPIFVHNPAVAQAEPEAVGWICQIPAQRWLQFSPCPATYTHSAPVDVDGVIAGMGQMVHGTGSVSVDSPVQSFPLDSNGVCAALADPSLRIPHHGSSDIYERSVLKSKFCS